MFNIFATAKSGLDAYQEKLDYLSNDLANMQTTGYKSTDVEFKDLVAESLNRAGTPLVNTKAVSGTGVKLGLNYSTNTQGSLTKTGNNTDLAINGEGYFALSQADGSIVYTRDGSFKVDANGTLVNSDGKKVYIQYANGYSEGNPALDSKNISIDSDGGITLKTAQGDVKIGTIPVFTAVGDRSFTPIGENCLIPTTGVQVTASTNYNIVSGSLENSNVDTTQTMTDIILTQKAFQLNSKALTTTDDLWGMINNMRS
jgi:flagellar basal-body rod protein FlgG